MVCNSETYTKGDNTSRVTACIDEVRQLSGTTHEIDISAENTPTGGIGGRVSLYGSLSVNGTPEASVCFDLYPDDDASETHVVSIPNGTNTVELLFDQERPECSGDTFAIEKDLLVQQQVTVGAGGRNTGGSNIALYGAAALIVYLIYTNFA